MRQCYRLLSNNERCKEQRNAELKKKERNIERKKLKLQWWIECVYDKRCLVLSAYERQRIHFAGLHKLMHEHNLLAYSLIRSHFHHNCSTHTHTFILYIFYHRIFIIFLPAWLHSCVRAHSQHRLPCHSDIVVSVFRWFCFHFSLSASTRAQFTDHRMLKCGDKRR